MLEIFCEEMAISGAIRVYGARVSTLCIPEEDTKFKRQ